MRQQHLLPINVRIIYKLLVTTHLAYIDVNKSFIYTDTCISSQDTNIPREIYKAIFKSGSTETT